MAYDTQGHLLSVDGPRTDTADVTTFTWYNCTTGAECGQLKTATDPLGHTTTFDTYNANGQLTQSTDPNGLVTSCAYDARQRLTQTNRGGRITGYSYDPLSRLVQSQDPIFTDAAGTFAAGGGVLLLR